VSTTDAFIAPVFTEVLLTGLSRLQRTSQSHSLFIGSPWLSDVPLFPGMFANTYPYLLPNVDPTQVATLGVFVETWIAAGGSCTLLTQGYHPHNHPRKNSAYYNDHELRFLGRSQGHGAEVLVAHRFHDKFLLVPDVVLSGSVNVTYSGLYRNRERLTLNTRSSAPNDFISAHAVCMNHVETARRAGPCDPPRQPYGVARNDTLDRLRTSYGDQWT
jgi:hypothetical protein